MNTHGAPLGWFLCPFCACVHDAFDAFDPRPVHAARLCAAFVKCEGPGEVLLHARRAGCRIFVRALASSEKRAAAFTGKVISLRGRRRARP